MSTLPVLVWLRPAGPEGWLGQALFFPEFSALAEQPEEVLQRLEEGLGHLLAGVPEQHHHNLAEPEHWVQERVVVQARPAEPAGFSRAVELAFDYLRWPQGAGLWGACVPALDLELLAPKTQEPAEFVAQSIEQELRRRGLLANLGGLVSLPCGPFEFRRLEIACEPGQVTEENPLQELATALKPDQMPRAYEFDELVEKLAEWLEPGCKSVLLCGPPGCGKTALVRELVRRKASLQLGATPFYETTGSRLLAGAEGFGMWQQNCQRLIEAAANQKAVVHLGALTHLLEAGRSASTPEGMAEYLRPAMARGRLSAICECDPEQLRNLEERAPHLLAAFSLFEMEAPGAGAGQSILLKTAVEWAGSEDTIELEALECIDRLHRRFATYSAYPGRPLRFLRGLLEGGSQKITEETVCQTFSQETGLPLFLVSPTERYHPDETLDYFASRVLGQPLAASMVTDAITRAKSGVTRVGRPIVSLLFVGPSGVGKTEMARTLAGFLFSDASRVVRFDMSEYSDPWAVERLIRGPDGAGALTSAVRGRPFSVVLFDELEKADPSLFDLLLGILGEGRVSDAAGRTADFSNTVVIMTSNLGVDSFRQSGMGLRQVAPTGDAHFVESARKSFRPELFNRIDRVIPFAPLEPADIQRLAAREVGRLEQRHGLATQRARLTPSPALLTRLSQLGYDAAFGARHLKRVVHDEVVVPLARSLCQGKPRVVGLEVKLEARATRTRAGERLEQAAQRRRRLDRLKGSVSALELENEITQLERLESQASPAGHADPDQLRWLSRLPARKALWKRLSSALAQAEAVEEQYLVEGPEAPELLKQLDEQAQGLLLALYSLHFDRPDQATVGIFAASTPMVRRLLALYTELPGLLSQCYAVFAPAHPWKPGGFACVAGQWVSQPDEQAELLAFPYRGELPQECLGAICCLEGPGVFARLEPETGLHTFDGGHHCLVEVSEGEISGYHPAEEVRARRTRFLAAKRRHYDYSKGIAEDFRLGKQTSWSGKNPAPVVGAWIEQVYLQRAEAHVLTS
ncbi:MAG: AAA family ATPase [Vulcanimicrobiota bacterium]